MIGYSKEQQLRGRKKSASGVNLKQYYKWIRVFKPECMVCGDYGEIHHVGIGDKRIEDEIVMLCSKHHSAQSDDGVHYNPKKWYERFYSLSLLKAQAAINRDEFLEWNKFNLVPLN